jgi:hypothetical protein
MIVLTRDAGSSRSAALPKSIHGLEISYVEFRVSDLPEYFTTRLRPGNDAFESVRVRIVDPEAARVFDTQREAFLQRHLPHYVLYLWLEDRIVENHYRLLPPISDRRYYKSFPGSKRSMLRYYWIARCLHGGLGTRDFAAAVGDCEVKSLLPDGFLRTYDTVTASLHRLTLDDEFLDRARTMVQWRDQSLTTLVGRFARSTVEPGYLELIVALADGDATPAVLTGAYDASLRYGTDRQWTLWLGLAAHPRTPRDLLVRLYRACHGRAAFKDIIRNLVRNGAFPLEALDEEMYANDEDVRWFKLERQQVHDLGVRVGTHGGNRG